MEALEKIASELENSKSKDGYTLMEHLTAMMERLVESPNEYPIEKIEELSYFTKFTRLNAPKLLPNTELKKIARVVSPMQEFITKFQKAITVNFTNLHRISPYLLLSR